MNSADVKRKIPNKVVAFRQQLVATARKISDGVSAVPCEKIIAGKNAICDDIKQEDAKSAVAQDHVKRDLNLLSLGKKLLDCCKVGNIAEVKILLRDGAPFIADWIGTSPLHYSVMNRHVEITELLLKQGICKDTKNKVGRTPLHIAAHMGLSYMVKLLLTYGADVNCTDMLNMTPLHWATESGDLLTAKILIDYGADTSIANKFGKTACTMARTNKQMEMVRLILDTELLPPSTRAMKVSDMKSKVVSCPRDMKPVAEILEPTTPGPGHCGGGPISPCPSPNMVHVPEAPNVPQKKKKTVVVIATSDSGGPMGTIRIGGTVDTAERSPSPEKMSADSAIKLLQEHGVTYMEPDKDTVLSSAVLSGHTIRLTDAGKLAFRSLEKNVRFEKSVDSDDEVNAAPAKRTKISGSPPKKHSSLEEVNKSSDVIIGSALSPCTIDLPSSNSTSDKSNPPQNETHDKNVKDKTQMYIQRMRDKRKEIVRHLEILENQRTIKQNELTQIDRQIKILIDAANLKNSM